MRPISGYDAWANNGLWDHEAFTDTNDNRLYDLGEPYVDGNGNGTYDEEQYDPALTGYIPAPYPGNTLTVNGDVGLEITLRAASTNEPQPGAYLAFDLPPLNRGTPIPGAGQFRYNIANCNATEVFAGDWLQLEPTTLVGPSAQGMNDLIDLDPNAYWDDSTQSVQGSTFVISPRIVLIALYDPRLATTIDRRPVQVTKVAAFFMARIQGRSLLGRLTRTRGVGAICDAGAPPGGSFISVCPLAVAIDIRPGSCANPLNVRSRGVLPVAILGTHDFDVTRIDPGSIRLAGVAPLRSALEDVATALDPVTGKQNATDCTSVGPDGLMDLALKFDNQAVAATLEPITKGDTQVMKLTGTLKPEFGRDVFEGEGVVTIVGGAKGSQPPESGGETDPSTDDPSGDAFASTLTLRAPNPYRQQAALAYTVPRSGWVRLVVCDLRGHLLATLVNARQEPGANEAAWDGKDGRGRAVPPGVYFIRLQLDDEITTGKIVLAR